MPTFKSFGLNQPEIEPKSTDYEIPNPKQSFRIDIIFLPSVQYN